MIKNASHMLLTLIARIVRGIGWLLAGIAGTLMVLTILDHHGLFSPQSPLFGVDYISPLWITLLFVASSALVLIAFGKRFWIPISVGLLYFVTFGDVSLMGILARFPQQAVASERAVRVATFNVEYYADGVDNVMDAIDQLNADIMLLGEHALSLKQETEMQRRLQGRMLVAGHPNSTAILSRFPIVWWKEVELPSHEASLSGGNDPDEIVKNRHRSFVHAIVNIDSQYVHVLSVRFIAGRPKDHTLKEQMRWGRFMFSEQWNESRFFAEYLKKLEGPVIFGCDLNACASSKAVSIISRIADDAYMKNNLFGDLTFRTEFPTLRLDYLFSMNGVRSVNARRPFVSVSDHFPVSARFVLPDRSPVPGQIDLGEN